jgi:hypothetical protein
MTSSAAPATPAANKSEMSAPASAPAASSTPAKKPAGKAAPSGAASDSETAAAKSGGKVWVNLDSGIYHKGGQFFGKTKNGKFMTESEAKAAGYKESKKD